MMLGMGGTASKLLTTVLPRKRVMRGEFNTSVKYRTVTSVHNMEFLAASNC